MTTVATSLQAAPSSGGSGDGPTNGRRRANPAERRYRIVSMTSPLVVLAIWELVTRSGAVEARFFPPPSTIVDTFISSLGSGEYWHHLRMTLSRVAVGFVIGAVPGVCLGLLMGLVPLVRAFCQPIITLTFPIPKLAVLPLFILIFGLGEGSKYAVLAVAVFYMVVINTAAGVANIEKTYIDVGHNFNASRLMMIRDVALPGALPLIMTGLKLGIGVAMLVIVGVEFVGASSGIGYMIWNSWQIFAVDVMYVGLITTAILGFLFSWLFDLVEWVLIPWRRR